MGDMLQHELPSAGHSHYAVASSHIQDSQYPRRHTAYMMDQPISGLQNPGDAHPYVPAGGPSQFGAPHQAASRFGYMEPEDGAAHNEMMYPGGRGAGDHHNAVGSDINQHFVTP